MGFWTGRSTVFSTKSCVEFYFTDYVIILGVVRSDGAGPIFLGTWLWSFAFSIIFQSFLQKCNSVFH